MTNQAKHAVVAGGKNNYQSGPPPAGSQRVCAVTVHRTEDGQFVVSDQAGWIPGVYESVPEALAAAAQANS